MVVRLQRKGQIVIPRALRERAGVTDGALFEIVWKRGHFSVTPKPGPADPFRDLAESIELLRQDAKAKGVDKMTKKQIEAAVAAMRRDLRAERKRRIS
jgi:bifunctional DNA-binding transcriptional regulator/antitoxin component of YhaV-PrlF toxin-antitoxin module